MKQISLDQWREMLTYDPATGLLTWLPRPRSHFSDIRSFTRWGNRFAGTNPSYVGTRGYIIIHISGQNYLGHRIAWALHRGQWPGGQIDHINGNRSDNRIQNLRIVDRVGNARNAALASNNKSGVSGVCWSPALNMWVAGIGNGGRWLNLGRFTSFDEAVSARRSAEKRLGYHPNHGRPAA